MAEQTAQKREPQLGIGELLARTGRELADLLRCEVELARIELTEEARATAKASVVLIVGAIAAVLAVLLLLFAAAWGLAEGMAPGWAFLIVGALTAVGATLLVLAGRQRLAQVDLVPRQTTTTLKEDARWASQQLR